MVAKAKKKLEIHKTVEVPNGTVTLERIESPKANVPGNRPIYFLLVSYIPQGTKSGVLSAPVRFDPFNLEESYRFGRAAFRIFVNPKDNKSLLIEPIVEATK